MNFSALHPDHFARQLAYTRNISRDVYPAIEPTLPAHSQKDKVIIITGGGTGIGGKGIAPAFAKADARVIVLVGRRLDKLEEAKKFIKQVNPKVDVQTFSADVATTASVDKLFQDLATQVGPADVLINNAGVQGVACPVAMSGPDAWWSTIDINLRGTHLMTRAFLKQLPGDKHGTIVNMASGAGMVVMPGMSSYGISKLAVMRFTEFVAAESENVTAVAMDPGTVDTAMQSTMPDGFRKFARDTPELAGAMAVWLSTKEAAFLTGRTVESNWPIDEMIAKKDEIAASGDLRFVLQGKFGIESS